MGLKKNFFKGLQNGLNTSPIKRENGVDKKQKVIDPRKKYSTEELQKLDPRNITAQMASNMEAPTSKQDYNARTYIRPTANNKENSTTFEKALNFSYNNPSTISMAMKIPYLKDKLIEETKNKMKESSGGSKVNLQNYDSGFQEKSYNEYLKDYNDQKADGYVLPDPETFEQHVANIFPSNNDYDGDANIYGDNSWTKSNSNPIDQFFSKAGTDLYKQSPYKPKSDFYEWQNRYSVKGDEFDKNANNYQINNAMGDQLTEELAFKSYSEKNPKPSDILKIEKLLNNGNLLTDDQREKLRNYDNNVSFNINEERQGKVNDYDKLTNAQLVPFQIENSMMNTSYFKNLVENQGISRGKDYGQMGGYKPNPVVDKAFESLYSGETPVIYGDGKEERQTTDFMNTDYGHQRTGFAMDKKLPYMSISDSWDFQATGKGGYNDQWSSDYTEVSDQYKQAQLVNQVAQEGDLTGGFKLYDRFYFTPDKYKDYIKDEDVEFMQEFYGADVGNNIDNMQPEMLEEIILTTKKNEKKSPGSTKFNRLSTTE